VNTNYSMDYSAIHKTFPLMYSKVNAKSNLMGNEVRTREPNQHWVVGGNNFKFAKK